VCAVRRADVHGITTRVVLDTVELLRASSQLRIASARFAKIGVVGYTKLAAVRSSTKIFLLRSSATQSLRNAADAVNARHGRFVFALLRLIYRFKKALHSRPNLQYQQRVIAVSIDAGDDVRAQSQRNLPNAHRSPRAVTINTSLSSAVSFSFCWCNRNAVQVDSRLAHFDQPSHSLEGNMAKKAKKAKKTAKKAAKKKKSKKK
jgi:hypothetical protein